MLLADYRLAPNFSWLYENYSFVECHLEMRDGTLHISYVQASYFSANDG